MHIYKLVHLPSGKTYVGKTIKLPMNRWSQHFASLKSNTHKTPKFQDLWNEDPNLTSWVCHTVWSGSTDTGWEMKYKEAEFILAVEENLRLNEPNTAVLSLERRQKIEAMLKEGIRMVEIRDTLGVSIGTISNVKREIS